MINLLVFENKNVVNKINLIHFEGDSITACDFFTNINDRYSSRFAAAYPNITVINTAVSSSIISGDVNSVKYRLDNIIPNATSNKDYFSCFIGINELIGGNATATYNKLVILWQDIISKGYKLIPWTLTAISPVYSQSMRDARVLYNTMIRNGYSNYADFLIEADNISGLDSYNTNIEPGTYYRDIIHPNPNGHVLLVNKFISILQTNNLI
jgi:hypothetical protein